MIDLNRPPDDVSLYPGQNTTGLCPIVQFSGAPVYRDGQAPTPDEVTSRIETYWRPYHDALAAELQRLHAAHGRVVLWEGHSIKGELPFLFDGRLPDLTSVGRRQQLFGGNPDGRGRMAAQRDRRVVMALQGLLNHPIR